MNLEFRQGTASDIPAMKYIRDRVRENALRNGSIGIAEYQRAWSEGKCWVCTADGKVIGFAWGRLAQRDVWALFLEAEFEGRGIGNRLMDLLETWMFANGCDKISLTTQVGTRAERLYRRRGWEPMGDLTDGDLAFVLVREQPH